MTSAQTPQIAGLPAGATVEPIDGLPAGATVEPIQQTNAPANDRAQTPSRSIWSILTEPTNGGFASANRGNDYDGSSPDQSSSMVRGAEKSAAKTLGGASELLGGPGATKVETDTHGLGEKSGGILETLMEYMGGDEALKGLSLAQKMKQLAPVAEVFERYPRLSNFVAGSLRRATTQTAQTGVRQGSLGDGLKDGATNIGLDLLFHGIGSGYSYVRGATAPINEIEAATRLTDAFNPTAEHIPGFEAKLGKHVGAVADYAERNGIKLDSRANVLNATKGAAEERQEFFRDVLLQPVADKPASVANIPHYAGGTQGEGNAATLGQLEARLVEINKTLALAHAKGGAAIGTEANIALTREAAGIRKTLYSEMGRHLNVPADAIADVNQGAGELSDLSDKMEAAVSRDRHAANMDARKPVSFNPLHRETEKFVADKVAGNAINKMRQNPDETVRHVFRHLDAEAPHIPQPNPQTKLPGARVPVYARGQADGGAAEATPNPAKAKAEADAALAQAQKPDAKTVAAQQERLGSRKEGNATAAQQAAQKRAQNVLSHGKYKGAESNSE